MRYELAHIMMKEASRSLLELVTMLPWITALVVVFSGGIGSFIGHCVDSRFLINPNPNSRFLIGYSYQTPHRLLLALLG